MSFATLIILSILTIFGFWYAWFIFFYPIKRTWLSVVIGTGANALASFAIIYMETNRLLAAATPILCLIVSGAPMIIGQEMKSYHARQLAKSITNDLPSEAVG